jgi:phage baseplate assembly protein W
MILSGLKYKDLNPRFGFLGQPPILQGDEAVKSAIRTLIASPIGSRSRTFNQRWGSALMELLQEPISQITAGAIRAAAFSSIKTWEPRVTLIENSCSFIPNYDLPGYDVKLVYTINDPSTVYAYTLSLKA